MYSKYADLDYFDPFEITVGRELVYIRWCSLHVVSRAI